MGAEAEESPDPGSLSGMSPATPDVVWKPAARRRSETDAGGSSCCSLSAATTAWDGGGNVESDDLSSVLPSSSAPPVAAGEQSQAESRTGEEECASCTQDSTVSPPVSECGDRIAQQEPSTQESTVSPPPVSECGDKVAQQESSTQESTISQPVSECGDKVAQQGSSTQESTVSPPVSECGDKVAQQESSTQESTISQPVSECGDKVVQQGSSTQESTVSPPVSECGDKVAQQESSTQESTVSPPVSECGDKESTVLPPVSESGDKIARQDGAASAIPTPEKVEATPRRPRKRSTKGLTRFKIMKDHKATQRTATPAEVKTKRKAKENGRRPLGDKSVRRKLDFEGDAVDFEGNREFSRAKLMEDLRCLAKVHGLCDGLGAGKRSKKGKKRKKMTGERQDNGELALVPYQKAPAATSSSALVPIQNSTQLAIVHHRNHFKNLRTKVLGLDEKTLQVYNVLRKWDETDSEGFEGVDIGSGPEWDETRRHFEHCVDVFIATVHGPRRFSEWGGSVTDSVVGTFLTQNVADNLSSNAFLNLVAKFPPTKRHINAEVCSNLSLLIDDMRRKLNLNEQSNGTDSGNSDFTKPVDFEKENGYNEEVKGNYGRDYNTIIENFISIIEKHHKDMSTWDNARLENLVKDKSGTPVCSHRTLRKFMDTFEEKDTSHWDKLREEAYSKGYNNIKGARISDSADWEAVLHAPAVEVANSIAVRGQHYVIALRIQAFLKRVKKDHGNFDLDWLRYVPRESAKNYLISILGLGDKSVDCIRLLSLKHKAFPAICTKVSPNCRACPFSAKCKYYNSSLARLSLPPAEGHGHEYGEEQASTATPGRLLLSNDSHIAGFQQVCQPQIKINRPAGRESIYNCEPIIEIPPSPEHEYEESPYEQELYEDDFCDIEDIIPELQYDFEIDLCSLKHAVNNGSWTPNSGKDLALVNSQHASVQNKKLKNIGRLRTEHNAYVLPDDHAILEEFEDRVPEDPCPYLLVVISCSDEHTVKGTILIPCRTATRGNFPLNGTYFQDHEVFADHSSSHSPITIPRECIWNLDRCIVYFGSSIQSIMKGQTRQDIEDCYKKGYICVRGFDRNTRYPKPICAKLHATNERNGTGENSRKRKKTSQEGKKIDDKSSLAN
uniref:Demeter RRM-fold domain-containing protein n=1 Tax=Oryza punctata TaxID=4537 RepID=A0A0E0K010_ORYPU